MILKSYHKTVLRFDYSIIISSSDKIKEQIEDFWNVPPLDYPGQVPTWPHKDFRGPVSDRLPWS